MTKSTVPIFKIFLQTPNNAWFITVPTISLIGDFISMTINYEGLDILKSWAAYDCMNGETIMDSEKSLGEWMALNPSINGIDMEIIIKEVIFWQ